MHLDRFDALPPHECVFVGGRGVELEIRAVVVVRIVLRVQAVLASWQTRHDGSGDGFGRGRWRDQGLRFERIAGEVVGEAVGGDLGMKEEMADGRCQMRDGGNRGGEEEWEWFRDTSSPPSLRWQMWRIVDGENEDGEVEKGRLRKKS